MPSNRSKISPKKPWHAYVKRAGVAYSLGYYETMAEAYAVEREFAITNPPAIKQRKKYVPDAL